MTMIITGLSRNSPRVSSLIFLGWASLLPAPQCPCTLVSVSLSAWLQLTLLPSLLLQEMCVYVFFQ